MGAVGYSTGLVPSMSLGCGPQAGNISSDNISARHLINIKRVGFPLRNWTEVERTDHARAAALGGEEAPRGSGLPGDPGLHAARPTAAARPSSSSVASNWQGNPAVGGMATGSTAPRSKVHRAPKAAAAAPLTFTRRERGARAGSGGLLPLDGRDPGDPLPRERRLPHGALQGLPALRSPDRVVYRLTRIPVPSSLEEK